MIFVTLTRPSRKALQNITIRGDHILQMSDRTPEEDADTPQAITWLLVQHTGWLPVMEDQDEIKTRIRAAIKEMNDGR